MRQITLDVETTGLSTKDGDRIVEIGCVEIIDRIITGKVFQTYCNPERLIGEMASKITGIKDEFLLDKPKFIEIIEDFLDFINGADELVIHNAAFDLEFINNELKLLKHPIKDLAGKFTVIDTLVLARTMHPGQRNNLDALAKRYDINFAREFHGALLDAKILANLILKMTAGQISLDFGGLIDNNQHDIESNNINCLTNYEDTKENKKTKESKETKTKDCSKKINNIQRDNNLKIIYANAEELAAHEQYLTKLTN